MMNVKVIFSIDPTGSDQDIIENVIIPSDVCLYCLHDKQNRLLNVVKTSLEYKGYDLRYYFQVMKIYVI